MKSTKMAMISVFLAASMWGTVGVGVKVLSGFGFTAIQMVAARLIVATVLLGIYLLAVDREKFKIEKGDLKYFAGTGICSMLFFNTCYCITVQLTSLSVAAILLYTSPIFVTLLSVPIFKEKLTSKKIMAMIGSVMGCALVSGILSNEVANLPLKGIMTGICAALGYALYGILARILVKKYHSYTILFYTFLIAGIGGIFISDIGGIRDIIINKPASLAAVVVIAMICNVAPYILYTAALQHIEASKASVFASIEPVVATILGTVLFHEMLNASSLIGILLVLTAIGILNKKPRTAEERL